VPRPGWGDSTIRNDTNHLELIRDWFTQPLWEMQPSDADVYFGKVLRDAKLATRTGRVAALAVFFEFLTTASRYAAIAQSLLDDQLEQTALK
jgi:hypothetical protein